jgi:hypothetical protein
MIIHKCDRCEKKFKNILLVNKVSIGTLVTRDYELCDNCIKEFYSFLKTYEKNEKIKE